MGGDSKTDNKLIGQCGLISVKETDETEVDYSLARSYWGRGIATEYEHRISGSWISPSVNISKIY